MLCIDGDIIKNYDAVQPSYFEGLILGIFIGVVCTGLSELSSITYRFLCRCTEKDNRQMNLLNNKIGNINNNIENLSERINTLLSKSECVIEDDDEDDSSIHPSVPTEHIIPSTISTKDQQLTNIFDEEEKIKQNAPTKIVHHISRKQETDILNTFDSIKGKKFNIACDVVKQHHYTLHPIYINDTKNKRALPSFDENVIGVFVRDPAFSIANTLTSDAIIESLIDVGGVDSRGIGRYL